MSLAELQQLTDNLVRDAAGDIAADARDQAIGFAVLRYGIDRPRSLVEDVTQPAGGQLLNLPSGWDPEASRLASIEYPIGRVPPAQLDFTMYRAPEGTEAMAAQAVPVNAVTRMTYTSGHTVDAGGDTTPAVDREAIAAWAAALLLDQLASVYAGSMDPTIPADSVNHGSKSGDYARRAQTLRKRYFDHLGIDPKRTVPASATAGWSLGASIGGPRINRRRWRP